MSDPVETYICNACGWIYDPEQGDPDGGIAPGTPWEEIPDDWICPVCGAGKDDFEPVEPPAVSAASHETGATQTAASHIVIVGSGLAGYTLAKELHKRDAALPVTIVTLDGGEVYTKPMLSNAFARHHQPDDMVHKDAAVKEIGGMLVSAMQGAGCHFHLGRTVARYARSGTGYLASLDDGTRVPFDHVLSAVGLTPRTRLAKDSGLQVQVGILVDRLLRANDPAIYALGDCAETQAGLLPFIAPLLAQARALGATLTGDETPLRLPAMPVVVKTPALPLVVCPPQPGAEGTWDLELGDDEAVAVFRTPDGVDVGFALAGGKTSKQQIMAERMPDLLPDTAVEPTPAPVGARKAEAGESYECETCGYLYDPKEGDPDGGIPPGTRWEDVPDDWICPTCGAGKEEFTKVS